MKENFYALAKQVNLDRLNQEQRQRSTLDYKLRMLHADFWLWCKAFEQDENNYKNFKIFIEKTNQEIDFWVKKSFMEKYFKFVFSFNYETKKWQIKNLEFRG